MPIPWPRDQLVGASLFDFGIYRVSQFASLIEIEFICQCKASISLDYPFYTTRQSDINLMIFPYGTTADERPQVKLCETHAALAFEKAYT